MSGRQIDREGLIHWASHRFQTQLTDDDLKEKEREQIAALLLERSRQYFPTREQLEELNGCLAHLSSSNGQVGNGHVDRAAVDEVLGLARRDFGVQLDGLELEGLNEDQVRQAVLQRFDARYRPELSQAERSLTLEVLDQAWKEHLYYMDHLRQGIGLVGYAQKDPKVEYKREGMKAFEAMWDRIGEQVTGAIFRLDKESPQFVGSLWQISAATHQTAASAAQEYRQAPPPPGNGSPSRGPEPGQHVQAVEPIRNRQPKVGRNDPCPCGSGKKYKKCCGEGMV